MVEVLSEVDLAVQGGHLLLVVQQFFAIDLLHIAVLVIQSLDLCFSLFKGEGLVEKVGLQFLVLLDYSGSVHIIFPLDLVHLDVPEGFDLNFLFVELRGDFPP